MRLKWISAPILTLILQVSMPAASETHFFAARRQALMKKIDGAVVLQGAPEPRAYERFRQANDFYYLSGVETPGAMLLLDSARGRSILFLPPRDPFVEAWEGARLIPGEEARAQSGFDEVLPLSMFEDELQKGIRGDRAVYTPFRPAETAQVSRDSALPFDRAQENNPWDGRVSREKAFQEKLRQKLGNSPEITDLSPVLDSMRRVKDDQEIQRLREAGRVGALGFVEVLRSAEPGRYEYQIASIADFIFKWHGAMGPGFSAIAGSGPNSCLVHYSANSRRTEAGDLVVLDFGPDYQYYQSDITRTFPVSGKFTEEQARVYNIVLEAYRAAVAKVKPGATFMDLNQAARSVLEREGMAKYLSHGISHYVGMSTHDVGAPGVPFEPGIVITVEPGIYIKEKALGVRIEDTLLVTKDGSEILSAGAPIAIPDIERLMAEPGLAPK